MGMEGGVIVEVRCRKPLCGKAKFSCCILVPTSLDQLILRLTYNLPMFFFLLQLPAEDNNKHRTKDCLADITTLQFHYLLTFLCIGVILLTKPFNLVFRVKISLAFYDLE